MLQISKPLKLALLSPSVKTLSQAEGLDLKHLGGRKILSLWARWVFRVRIEGMNLDEAQLDHCRWCLEMFDVGITRRQILRSGLDDPRIPIADRRVLARDYLKKWNKRPRLDEAY
jgi:hypothetical protein